MVAVQRGAMDDALYRETFGLVERVGSFLLVTVTSGCDIINRTATC